VHFVYWLFLRREALAGALAMLQEEVRLFPDHAEAHAEIAFEILERGTPADALAPAREAARLAPGQPASHLAYGRALVATGAVDEGTAELEEAAYAAAGRTADVARARARLLELDAKRGAQPD
jgi:predicted Zn-dependent protease